MDEEVQEVDEHVHEREEDTHRRKGELKTLEFHDEVRDVGERLHGVLTTLDFHDFRRTGAKTIYLAT